jgi:thiamine biosynthesis lipoprotein
MNEFKRHARLMGSDFEFIIVADEENGLIDECISEIKRIETLLTEFSETSQTSLLNKASGSHAVKVDAEVYEIIKRSLKLSVLTQGAFDISAGALKKLYNFKGKRFEWPSDELVTEKLQTTGYNRIKLLNNNEVFLEVKGMHIAFGAIGKGYAADRVKNLLLSKGIKNGVVNASGDLTAWGTRADGSPWKIGIANPNDQSLVLAWLPVENSSVATSGDYEQFVFHNNTKYSHNIDPKTGYPVKGVKSVTIISPSAELSDALATAVFVMGPDVGIDLINQLPGIHCLVVDESNSLFTSRHLKLNRYEEAVV